MSAALALAPATLRPTRLPERSLPSPRPPLRLVPTGPDVVPAAHAVRLTRRGRLIRTGAVIAMTAALGWTAVNTVTAGAVPPAHAVTVESGQTLFSIASRELPGVPVREGVARIQLANGLSSSDVHTGQILQIPAQG